MSPGALVPVHSRQACGPVSVFFSDVVWFFGCRMDRVLDGGKGPVIQENTVRSTVTNDDDDDDDDNHDFYYYYYCYYIYTIMIIDDDD